MDLSHAKKVFLLTISIFVLVFNLKAQKSDITNSDFNRADSIGMLYPNHSITNLKELSEKLTFSLDSEIDKFRAIYRWVCENIENDYTLYALNKRKREKLNNKPEELKAWNKKFNKRVSRQLIENHRTVCTGYAYLVKELAYHVGIDCEVVHGYGRTAHSNIGGPGYVNHSWNAVKLNNQWYLCDATWSSGDVNTQRSIFIKHFSEGYFLANPSLFVRNHYPLDTSKMLLKQKPSLQAFLNGPLVYKSTFAFKGEPIAPETFRVSISKGEQIRFQYDSEDKEAMDSLQLQIVKGNHVVSVFPEITSTTDDSYQFHYSFRHKGKYAMHVLIRDKYAFSYDINVTN